MTIDIKTQGLRNACLWIRYKSTSRTCKFGSRLFYFCVSRREIKFPFVGKALLILALQIFVLKKATSYVM